MTHSSEEELLARIARRYYIDGARQADIAKELGVTRSNISRLLSKAKEQGIIKFEIKDFLYRDYDLEEQLLRHFPALSEAWVLQESALNNDLAPIDRVGTLAGQWFKENLLYANRVSLTWGRAIHALVSNLKGEEKYPDLSIGMIGGDLPVSNYAGHDLIHMLGTRLGARYSYLHAPAICESAQMAKALKSSPAIHHELEAAKQSDIVFLGVGGYSSRNDNTLISSILFNEKDLNILFEKKPIADIAARFLDENGNELDTPIKDRTLVLSLKELSQIPKKVAVFSGEQKALPALSAIKSGVINTIICDYKAGNKLFTYASE